ncbi:MAG: retroviral-like aspartic protease family protein [Candidatus Dadabacteria bacterium]|nr:retroviral-like aspartic protease family protein [Candidatus Dadabacteria bacterium]
MLGVRIGFDRDYFLSDSTNPDLPEDIWPALVDTGAAESCIDSALADILNLPVVDRRNVSGVHRSAEVNIHLAQIYAPSLQFTTYGRFAGVHLTSGGQLHRALIGRSFLRSFTMIYNGITGSVELELRTMG